jgi:hypothetical protein
MVNGLFKIRKWSKVHNNDLVYIYVLNEFVIGVVVMKLLIKRFAIAIVNNTVVACIYCTCNVGDAYVHPLYMYVAMYPYLQQFIFQHTLYS